MDTDSPELTGDQVVAVVETAMPRLAAERDELRALLRQVAEARFQSRPNEDGTFSVRLSPRLMGEIARACRRP
jgi:hypothetical protein